MNQLGLTLDPLIGGYNEIYEKLSELRESFHRSGRLDDSNAKLDEVAKLFATYLAFKRKLIPEFPDSTSPKLILSLQESFRTAASLPQYAMVNGRSIFGADPKLVLRVGDESLAQDLVNLVRQCVDLAFSLRSNDRPFDILNEAFGHFVRDNFRGNIEDAQYMTPPEAVDFMVDMVLNDLYREEAVSPTRRHLTVLDPSCGVGSFLATFYHRVKAEQRIDLKRLHLLGQDKVERMVRLATINLELFDVEEHRITVGNSLEHGSSLDVLNGSVDLILTNPPFGARFTGDAVRSKCGANTPFFTAMKKSIPSIDSELLFVDRNLKLLRDGGRLLIVVPDGVVSAKGTAALLRQHLAGIATVKAIVELPAVTFAQAGTRTKTAVVYLQKVASKKPGHVFMAVAHDLGFQVSTRKGVQIKQTEGENQLLKILASYIKMTNEPSTTQPVGGAVLCRAPSCVVVEELEIMRGSWTPNHYSSIRLDAVSNVRETSNFEMVPLHTLVQFCSDNRRNEKYRSGMAYLSVLHVLGEGFVDVAAAKTYAPKTPGVPIFNGEILVARINPRIPRVCIAPNFDSKALCSSEFEVLKANDGVDPYLLTYLLLSDVVQSQIRSLTSGTSASHNRIRSSELATVLIPTPRPGSEQDKRLKVLAKQYQDSMQAMVSAAATVGTLRAEERSIFV